MFQQVSSLPNYDSIGVLRGRLDRLIRAAVWTVHLLAALTLDSSFAISATAPPQGEVTVVNQQMLRSGQQHQNLKPQQCEIFKTTSLGVKRGFLLAKADRCKMENRRSMHIMQEAVGALRLLQSLRLRSALWAYCQLRGKLATQLVSLTSAARKDGKRSCVENYQARGLC